MEKREKKKLRGVVNASFQMYVEQAFVFQGMHELVVKTCNTPPGGGAKAVEWWKLLCSDAKYGYLLPLDYPKFDHIPPWSWIETILDCVAAKCAPRGKRGDAMRACWVRLRARMRDCVVRVLGEDIKYMGGVLSGWWITADLDTLINHVLERGLRSVYKLRVVRPSRVKGDDTLVYAVDRRGAIDWVEAFKSVFRLDAARFPTDGARGEFLRYHISKIPGRAGYSARAASGLLWSNAWQGESVVSAASFCSTFELLIARGMDRHKCERCLLTRLASHFGSSIKEASDWLHTPAAFGGRGWLPYGVRMRECVREAEIWEGEYGIVRRATTVEDLSQDTYMFVRDAMRALGLPTCASKSIVAGFALRGGVEKPDRERLRYVGIRSDIPNPIIVQPWMRIARPRWSVDPIWMDGILLRGEWEQYCEDERELERLRRVERFLGRGWFRSWALGAKVVRMPGEPECSKFIMSGWEGDGIVGGDLIPKRNPRSTGGMRIGLYRAEQEMLKVGKSRYRD